jgi:hypothetical protein
MKKIESAAIVLSFLLTGIFFGGSLFAVSVLADPQIQVSSTVSPSPVSPGSDGYVQLTFTNTGNSAASSIQIVGVTHDSSISVSSDAIGNVGSLGAAASSTALVKFSVASTATSGLYIIRFQINICTSSCSEIDPNAVVTVQTSSALEVSSVQPSTLSAGEITVLHFKLLNEGKDPINNIIMTWSMPDNEILPLGISNRQFITSIGGGSSLDIPVNVSVASTVTPGVYPLSVQLAYRDKSGMAQNFSSSIGIKIGGMTDFDIGLQSYSAGTASLSIANIGVNPATSVSVSVPEQSNFAVSGASSVFLGTLNAGDFSVASFQLTSRFSRTVNGGGTSASTSTPSGALSNGLTVEITYSDTSGARQTVQKQITLNLAAAETGSTGTTAIRNRGFLGLSETVWIAIVAVIVAAFALLWFFKFRKKKNFLNDFFARIFARASKKSS